MSRLQTIKKRIKELEEESFKLEQFGEDEFKNGTVLRFKYQYIEGGKSYTFAALKITNRWFLTGRYSAGHDYMTWEQFVEFLANANAIKSLKVATEWRSIDD